MGRERTDADTPASPARRTRLATSGPKEPTLRVGLSPKLQRAAEEAAAAASRSPGNVVSAAHERDSGEELQDEATQAGEEAAARARPPPDLDDEATMAADIASELGIPTGRTSPGASPRVLKTSPREAAVSRSKSTPAAEQVGRSAARPAAAAAARNEAKRAPAPQARRAPPEQEDDEPTQAVSVVANAPDRPDGLPAEPVLGNLPTDVRHLDEPGEVVPDADDRTVGERPTSETVADRPLVRDPSGLRTLPPRPAASAASANRAAPAEDEATVPGLPAARPAAEAPAAVRPAEPAAQPPRTPGRAGRVRVGAVGVAAGLALFIFIAYLRSDDARPTAEELQALYPYGMTGAYGPDGQQAPGALDVRFKLLKKTTCTKQGEIECLQYEYRAGTFAGTMMLRRTEDGWTRFSNEGMPFKPK